MTSKNALDVFKLRVTEEWLPAYCSDPRKQYSPDGFKIDSIKLDASDARDCMRAIDAGVVRDVGSGRYLASQGKATEPLFWEGSRDAVPRPITLWLEPAITFAALARLHFDYNWPPELLGNQPTNWAFDLAAHDPMNPDQHRILGEVKKTSKEAENLVLDLVRACAENSSADIRKNSAKKWKGLLLAKPPTLWIIGPAGYSRVFGCTYPSEGTVSLWETTNVALRFPAA